MDSDEAPGGKTGRETSATVSEPSTSGRLDDRVASLPDLFLQRDGAVSGLGEDPEFVECQIEERLDELVEERLSSLRLEEQRENFSPAEFDTLYPAENAEQGIDTSVKQLSGIASGPELDASSSRALATVSATPTRSASAAVPLTQHHSHWETTLRHRLRWFLREDAEQHVRWTAMRADPSFVLEDFRANDRTFMSWVRTSLRLVLTGAVVGRLLAGRSVIVLGVMYAVAGMIIVIAGIVRFYRWQNALHAKQYLYEPLAQLLLFALGTTTAVTAMVTTWL
eukprot:ctg_299.g168